MVILLKYLSIIKELIYMSLTLKSGASLVAQMVRSLPAMQETWV